MSERVNTVVAGDNAGATVVWDGSSLKIAGFMFPICQIDKNSVFTYSLVEAQKKGFFGGFNYLVDVEFSDGRKSLLFLNDAYYQRLIRILY